MSKIPSLILTHSLTISADNEPLSEQQPSTSGQSVGRSASFSSLADSFGSQKAFVSEEEWRVMDKKVGAASVSGCCLVPFVMALPVAALAGCLCNLPAAARIC